MGDQLWKRICSFGSHYRRVWPMLSERNTNAAPLCMLTVLTYSNFWVCIEEWVLGMENRARGWWEGNRYNASGENPLNLAPSKSPLVLLKYSGLTIKCKFMGYFLPSLCVTVFSIEDNNLRFILNVSSSRQHKSRSRPSSVLCSQAALLLWKLFPPRNEAFNFWLFISQFWVYPTVPTINFSEFCGGKG